MNSRDHSGEEDERLNLLLEHFAERLNLIFSVFFFQIELGEDDDLKSNDLGNNRSWMLRTIHNACLHTTLIALRDVDDFLTVQKNKKQDDDLSSSDFGYQENSPFLTKEDRRKINKFVAHSTTVGALNPQETWDVFELATKAFSQATTFLAWVEERYPISPYFYLHSTALLCRTRTGKILKYIGDFIQKRRSRTK